MTYHKMPQTLKNCSCQECIDMRKETCYISHPGAISGCGQPMSRPQTRVVCCCSMGTAWGPACEACPVMGTQAYQDLCGQGTPGVNVIAIKHFFFATNAPDK
jgi:hypothetical protein